MIRKSMPSGLDLMSGNRFSSRQTQSVCAEVMLKQRDEMMIQFNRIII